MNNLNSIKDTFEVAIKAIMLNKARSFLTMLGVIIGVGSVVLLTSIGTGLSAFVTDEFNELGANTLFILPNDVFSEGGGISAEQSATSIASSKLSLREVNALNRLRSHVNETAPLNLRTDTVSYRDTEKTITIVGTTASYSQVNNTPAEVGRFFSETENEGNERVAVLGSEVATELFGEIDPVRKKIKIGSQTYTVVGVAVEKGGGFGGPSFDAYVFIPLNTFFRQFDTDTLLRIIVKTNDPQNINASIRAVEDELSKTLEDDEFAVIDQAELLATINQILGALTVGLGGISAISLVVGGIGIMNIMLVSVTERTREIGLRKALGATPNVILLQFLIEAALLSLIGGTIGVIIAFLGTAAIQSFIPAKVTPEAVVIAFTVSTAVGLVFGAAPARRAAKLSPIEALRYE